MAPHEQRVVNERNDLVEKTGKLDTFRQGDVFSELPYEDRKLLQAQRSAMQAYIDILDMRIARFT